VSNPEALWFAAVEDNDLVTVQAMLDSRPPTRPPSGLGLPPAIALNTRYLPGGAMRRRSSLPVPDSPHGLASVDGFVTTDGDAPGESTPSSPFGSEPPSERWEQLRYGTHSVIGLREK